RRRDRPGPRALPAAVRTDATRPLPANSPRGRRRAARVGPSRAAGAETVARRPPSCRGDGRRPRARAVGARRRARRAAAGLPRVQADRAGAAARSRPGARHRYRRLRVLLPARLARRVRAVVVRAGRELCGAKNPLSRAALPQRSGAAVVGRARAGLRRRAHLPPDRRRGRHRRRLPMSAKRPTILFFNINGTGLGHLTTCLAYAHRLREHARPVFFSLAAAVEKIHDMGFEADYFVSPAWSRAATRHWNRQLALRVGLMLERVRPDMLVFDGTWPFHGLLHAATAHGVRRLVWSNLVLYKDGMRPVPVSENRFDLVIRLGEIGTRFMVEREERPGRRVVVPPVTLLRDDDLLTRDAARAALGLERGGRYALFSLGPGNLKDIAGIGRGLIDEMKARGFTIVWTHTPITVKDVPLPEDVVPIAVYPLARYMRAFDVYVGAAGYNSCCEVLQSGVPARFVPNTLVVDDQTRRAERVAEAVPAVVSPCETASQRADAVSRLMELAGRQASSRPPLDGAERAA